MKYAWLSLLITAFFFNSSPSSALERLDLLDWEICTTETLCKKIIKHSELSDLPESSKGVSSTVLLKARFKAQSLQYGSWIFIGEVGDTLKVRLNNFDLIDLNDRSGQPQYFRFLSLFAFIPPQLIQERNEIKFEVTNLNQTIFGLRSDIQVGAFPEVILRATFDFLMRTGSSLLSAFTLFFLSISTFVAFYFLRKRQLAFLGTYGFISIIYLISFSEIPRNFLNPILLSGPIHFSFRFFQDLTLALLISDVFRTKTRNVIKMPLIVVYSTAMVALWVTYFLSGAYPPVQRVMFFCAPLVALPTILGFFLSKNLRDSFERKWSLRIFFLLVLLQISDLLVFWQIYNGFFFVKWYIPIIFIFILFILIRRAAFDLQTRAVNEKIGSELRQVAHDLFSPLTSLKVVAANLRSKDSSQIELHSILAAATQRLYEISGDVLHSRSKNKISSLSVFLSRLKEVCRIQEHATGRKIHSTIKTPDCDVQLPIEISELLRVVENILKNAHEASFANQEAIELTLHIDDHLRISVSDFGSGFHPETIAWIGEENLTRNKPKGTGLGLSYSLRMIESVGGLFIIKKREPRGSIVTFSLPIKRDTFNSCAVKDSEGF